MYTPPIAALLLLATSPRWVHTLHHLGMLGLFLLSMVDASFVPLPIPGCADLFIALLAAHSKTWLWLTLVSTAGSVAGGAACYHAGALGGRQLLEKRIPKRYFDRITNWVEEHATLAVAIPAILPPPFPLIPFVLAAGALRMPAKKFYTAFGVSRFARHALFAWLGIHYAHQLRKVWPLLSSPAAITALIIFWVIVCVLVAYGIVKLVRTSRETQQSKKAAANPATA